MEPMKINLNDATFTIPIRIDSEERLENLNFIVNYLNKYFTTNIMVQEHDAEQKVHGMDAEYSFVQDGSILFYRTKILNDMCRRVKTPIIVNYDCDVVFPPDRYLDCAETLRTNQADGVYPYDGRFLDVDRKYMPEFMNGNFNNIEGHILNPNSAGGCVFWDRAAYIEGGMENERFISWGPEDVERYERFIKLGYRIARLPGFLFHFHHRRIPINDNKNPLKAHNDAEFKKVTGMSKEELQEYVRGWY